MDINRSLVNKSLSLPESPGVYLMKDSDGNIIYVGKAINLKRRVNSYFVALGKHNQKTRALVAKIYDFDFILVSTELEALLLENSLIKKYMPHYNILLKDDKGYPYIEITGGNYPTLKLARDIEKRGEFFGPYYGASSAKSIIEAANYTYRLPTCVNPNPQKQKRPCLNYYIGRCVAPCSGKISKEEFSSLVSEARKFLNGNIEEILNENYELMQKASESLEFEKAAVFRDRIKSIKTIVEKQTVSKYNQQSGDYLAAAEHEGYYSLNIVSVTDGTVTGNKSFIAKSGDFDSFTDFISDYFRCYYGQNTDVIPRRICTDIGLDDKELYTEYLFKLSGIKTRIVPPQDKTDRDLVGIAQRNAVESIIQAVGRTNRTERVFFELTSLLNVDDVETIEIYDISHLMGKDAVCGMAVCSPKGFVKKKYKKYKISPDNSGDDGNSLAEAVERRIKRALDGDESFLPLPQVIFADGGLTQLHAVKTVMEKYNCNIHVFGLKKDSRHRTKSLVFDDSYEIMLYKHPEIFSLCGRMQEEAHRFSITYHNNLARRKSLISMFEEIPGIGKAKSVAIVKKFNSIKAIKNASVPELMEIKGINEKLAESIKTFCEENIM